MTSVAIVVLNWNGIKDTLMCLHSLLEQDYENTTIIVVDNGSSDTSVFELNKIALEKKIILLPQTKNTGFAGGVNIGIEYALDHQFDAIALFNNDAIAEVSWLTNLIHAMNEQNASIVTGLLLDGSGRYIDSTAEKYTIWGMPFPTNRNKPLLSVPPSDFVFGATGGATLYKASLFKKVGLFDEIFFAYYEDVDFSFRTQLAGEKIYFTHKAVAYHNTGTTSKKIPGFTIYQTFKNIPLLYVKNVPFSLLFPIGIRLFFLYGLMFFKAVIRRNGYYALKGWLASIGYFWTNSLWKRISIQSQKKVSTSYINDIILHDLPPDQTGMRKFRKLFMRKAS